MGFPLSHMIWTAIVKGRCRVGVPRRRRMACEPVISKFGLAPFWYRQSGPRFSWASKSTRLSPHVFTIQTVSHCFPQQNFDCSELLKKREKKSTVSLFHCVLMGKMSRKFFWSGVSGCGTKGFPKAVEQVGYPKSCSNNFNLVSHVFFFFNFQVKYKQTDLSEKLNAI